MVVAKCCATGGSVVVGLAGAWLGMNCDVVWLESKSDKSQEGTWSTCSLQSCDSVSRFSFYVFTRPSLTFKTLIFLGRDSGFSSPQPPYVLSTFEGLQGQLRRLTNGNSPIQARCSATSPRPISGVSTRTLSPGATGAQVHPTWRTAAYDGKTRRKDRLYVYYH